MTNRHTCLVVEDDAESLEASCRMLEVFDFDCIGVRSYAEARGKIDAGCFCLILTDLGILPTPESVKPEPELGLELVAYARKRYPGYNPATRWHRVPVIVLSSLDTANLRDAMRRGADDFLTKPLGSNRVSLSSTLGEALVKAGRHDHAQCEEVMRLARRANSEPPPSQARADAGAGPRIGVTGRKFGKRLEISIDERVTTLTERPFAGYLQLIRARLANVPWLSREDLGAAAGSGWKGCSEIHLALKDVLADRLLIENDGAGGYRLAESVELGELVIGPHVGPGRDATSVAARAIEALLAKKN
jgi:CheY-like chemotaxis protein